MRKGYLRCNRMTRSTCNEADWAGAKCIDKKEAGSAASGWHEWKRFTRVA